MSDHKVLTVHRKLDDPRDARPDAIVGLAQVISGVRPLGVVDDERAILEDSHVERRDDRLELGRWLPEEIWPV